MEGESQNAQDARVENLWQTLDTKKEGQLDLAGLQKGLRKIDHRRRPEVVYSRIQLTTRGSPEKRKFSSQRRTQCSRYQWRWSNTVLRYA